jgi:hypothetical protein
MNVLIKFQTIDWLVNNEASINMCEGSQRTPLHLAVATGRADVVLFSDQEHTQGVYNQYNLGKSYTCIKQGMTKCFLVNDQLL